MNELAEDNKTDKKLAKRSKRLAAAVVDIFIFLPLVSLMAQPLGLTNLQENGSTTAFDLEQKIKLFLIGQLLFLLVQGYLLYSRGQTIGKILLKIRIVNMREEIPSITRLYLLRYFSFSLIVQIPIIGGIIAIVNLLFIFGKDQRCLHDYLAGTQVLDISAT